MKRKVTKIKSHSKMLKRLAGYGTFRVTGPCAHANQRVSIEFMGTREQAETVLLEQQINNRTIIAKDYN